MITKETEAEFDGAFMNNGVNGVLDDKFQEPKMLMIKAFISTHFTDNRVLEEKLDKLMKKVTEGEENNDFKAAHTMWNGIKALKQSLLDKK